MEYHIARINYHYRKLRMTRGLLPAIDAGANVEFEAYVFFEVCFHLKDWIKTDPAYKARSHDVERYINTSAPLRVLHDICNRLKHRTLSRAKTDIGPFDMTFSIGVGPEGAFMHLLKLSAIIDGEDRCLYALADQCMIAWADYFTRNPDLSRNIGSQLITPAWWESNP